MNRQASPSPRSGGGRGWLLFVAALVFAILLFAVVRRPQQPPAPARAPAADHVEKPATPDKLPQIPFKDVTAEYGITFVPHGGATGEKMLPESGGSGCALFDYDGDGDPDLLLISGHEWPWDEPPVDAPASTLALYRNDGEKFTDVTAEAGLSADFYGQGAAVGDYDADGDDDLYVTAVGPNRLYRNDGGKFTEATADAGVAGDEGDWTTSAGFFDYDRDGDLDLFVCNYLRWTRERDQEADRRVPGTGVTYAHPSNFDGVQNFLYRNDGGKFVEVGEEAGIHVDDPATGKPLGKALAVTFVDFDGDGWLDVFVANDTVRHFLYRNLGDGTFEEVGGGRGFALNALGVTTSGMGVDFAWLYNDDRLAVAVSNFAGEMTELYLSQPGPEVFFTDEAVATGVSGPSRDRLTFGLLFDDMDLDSRPDMLQANGHLEPTITTVQPNQQYEQSAQLFWNAGGNAQRVLVPLPSENVGDLAKPIVGRGLASADLDGDGDLDLVLTQVDGPPLVARNDQESGGHWLRCKLLGPPGNPHAIGATIELKTGGTTQRRAVMPTRSYLSQSEPIVTFGLGDATSVDSLVVTWPDGSRQTVNPDGIDRLLMIEPNKESFASLANMATARLENGEFEEAIALLKRARELQPDSLSVRRNLARAYLLGGQPAAAIAELDELPSAASDASPAIEYLRGLAAIRLTEYEEAVKHFRAALKGASDVATVHFQLALALSALGQNDEAETELEKTAQLDPLHGGAQYQLATYARKAGDQQAFRRYMRDFERIRKIKGPADALALEECKFTKPETMTETVAAVADKSPPALTPAIWKTEAVAGAPKLAAAAVWSLEDSGAYRLVSVTDNGELVIFELVGGVEYREIARSDQPLVSDATGATIAVANALVDAPYRRDQDAQVGDYPEIAVVTPRQSWLVRYTPEGGFQDLTAKAGLAEVKGDVARWADLDHDGDVDLVTASTNGMQVWRNNSDGSFVQATSEFGLAATGPIADFAAVDLEGVNLGVDLAVVNPERASLWRNEYEGKFAGDQLAADWPAGDRVLADDFNNDGLPDFIFLAPAKSTVALTGAEQQQLANQFGTIDSATTIDVDNDGWLDVIIAGRVQGASQAVLLRNARGKFTQESGFLTVENAVARGGLLDFDANSDGKTDLLQIAEGGSAMLLRNETSGDNQQLKLALRSYAGHPSSIGVRIQARRDDFVVTRFTQRELPIEIGMGNSAAADVIQTLWMNGVARNEIDVELSHLPLRITIIEFVRTSSCPFLYAWLDGRWQFVTDLLGTAPLNVSVARDVPMPPDPDEVVVLGPAEQFANAGAAARIRITSELREATYLDEVRLLAVDHPAGSRVFSCDRAAMAPVDGPKVVVGRDAISLQSAVGSDGIDRTDALLDEDGHFAEPGELLPQPSVGFTKPLSIEFGFDELPDTDDLLLVMTGWFRFGDSSTNIASAQRGDLQVIWPRLEVQTADEEWHVVDEMVGFPAGNTKMIVCDLSHKLPVGARRFRLTTSFEVRWDWFALYHRVPTESIHVASLAPTSAHLHWHGFAELRPTSFDRPQVPNLERIRQTPPWFTALEGWCTRYGDVLPLVDASDKRLAILNSGDGATFEFAADDVPRADASLDRTLLLYTRGWIKEENPNSLADRNVEPFPGSDSAASDSRDDWQLEYNTRWVPRNRFHPAPNSL